MKELGTKPKVQGKKCGVEFISHLFKAESVDDYPNPATRLNVADKMREAHNYHKHSDSITLEMFLESLKFHICKRERQATPRATR